MLAVRPCATDGFVIISLQTFDQCLNIGGGLLGEDIARRWPNFYVGLHEQLTAQDTSEDYNYIVSIGHVLASDPRNTGAQLDFSIRRGCNVSCCNKKNITPLRSALSIITQYRQRMPSLSFFQVLADAHASFDDNPNASNGETAGLIEQFIAEKCDRNNARHRDIIAILDQIVQMFKQ
jgi:hypothetical protein